MNNIELIHFDTEKEEEKVVIQRINKALRGRVIKIVKS